MKDSIVILPSGKLGKVVWVDPYDNVTIAVEELKSGFTTEYAREDVVVLQEGQFAWLRVVERFLPQMVQRSFQGHRTAILVAQCTERLDEKRKLLRATNKTRSRKELMRQIAYLEGRRDKLVRAYSDSKR